MSDLPYKDASLPTKIVGANPSTGLDDNFMEVDTSGRLTVKITDSSGASINLGQTTMALSLPVALASDQTGLSINLNGLPNFQTSQYMIGLTATQITVIPLTNRSSISIKVVTTTPNEAVYMGNSSGVTTATGYPLFNNETVSFDLSTGTPIWFIGTAAGQSLYVLEIGG